MANPSGEKNIGPWEGQQVEYIPLDDLVLWTENPRDPLDGDYTNDDVIRRATDGRNDKQWQLSKLSKEMGDRFDLSELPTVCRIDDGPKYRVYDGNRRVILAMLRKAGLTTEGQQQLVPPDFPDPIPCNVCDEETALENVERKHRGNGSWKQYEYCGFGRTQCADMREIDAEVEAAPHSKGSGAREHRSQRAADRRGYSLISGGLRGHASWKDPSGQSSCMPQGLCRAGSVEGTIHRGMGSGIQRLSQGHPSAPMIPHAAGMDGIQRTPPFCGSWLPWLACTGISGRGAPAVRLPLPLPRYRRIVGWMACRPAGSPAVA